MPRRCIPPATEWLKFEPSIQTVPRARHRTPRSRRCACIAPGGPLITARASLKLITRSPACQAMVSVDVLSVRAAVPVAASKFSVSAVRVDRWKGAAGRGALNGVLSVFMGIECPSFNETTRVKKFVSF